MSKNQAKVEEQTLGGGADGIGKASDEKTPSHERERMFKAHVARLTCDVNMYGTEVQIGSQTFELYPYKDYSKIGMVDFFVRGHRDFLEFTTATFSRLLKSYLIPLGELQKLQYPRSRLQFFPTARHPILVKDGDEGMAGELLHCVKTLDSPFWFYDFEADFLGVDTGILAEMKFARWLVYLAALNDTQQNSPGTFSDVKVCIESLDQIFEYFMTDDADAINEKLRSLGYRSLQSSDFRLNHALAPEVRERMAEYGTQYSMTFSNGNPCVLNWYSEREGQPLIVFLDELKVQE